MPAAGLTPYVTLSTLPSPEWISTMSGFVVTDPRFVRPAEVDLLLGDAGYAKQKLGWEPQVEFEQLVNMMVDADLARLSSK